MNCHYIFLIRFDQRFRNLLELLCTNMLGKLKTYLQMDKSPRFSAVFRREKRHFLCLVMYLFVCPNREWKQIIALVNKTHEQDNNININTTNNIIYWQFNQPADYWILAYIIPEETFRQIYCPNSNWKLTHFYKTDNLNTCILYVKRQTFEVACEAKISIEDKAIHYYWMPSN